MLNSAGNKSLPTKEADMKERKMRLRTALKSCIGEPSPVITMEPQHEKEYYYSISDFVIADSIKTMAEEQREKTGVDLCDFRLSVGHEQDRLKSRIMVILDDFYEKEVRITFQPFNKLAFCSTDGKLRPTACIDEKPFFTLVFPCDSDSFFFRDSRTRQKEPFVFNRFVNSLMMENDLFRNVMCSILTALEKRIYADLVKTIQRDHCLLLPFTIEEYLYFEDEDELLFDINCSGIPMPSLDISLNQWFYLLRMSLHVQDKDWDILTEYCKSRTDYFNEDDQINDGPDSTRFFTNYLMAINPARDQQDTWEAVNDYIRLTQEEKEELLSIKAIEDL